MNNYIIIGQYLMNIIIYSIIITNKYKNDKHIHYELEKTKKYLQAYIKNKNIKTTTCRNPSKNKRRR